MPITLGRILKKYPNAPEPHDQTQPTTTKPRKSETPFFHLAFPSGKFN